MRLSTWIPSFLVALLAGCLAPTPSAWDDANGPKARLADTVVVRGDSKVDFFQVVAIGTHLIPNSAGASRVRLPDGRSAIVPVRLIREIPARSIAVAVIGETLDDQAAADELPDAGNLPRNPYGTVRFTPLAGHGYVVNGTIGDRDSAVWIEDEDTHAVVGNKIEIRQ